MWRLRSEVGGGEGRKVPAVKCAVLVSEGKFNGEGKGGKVGGTERAECIAKGRSLTRQLEAGREKWKVQGKRRMQHSAWRARLVWKALMSTKEDHSHV